MEVISFPESAIIRRVLTNEDNLTSGEIKLLNWALAQKAFSKKAKEAIDNFLLKKEGSTLSILTGTEMNALKIKALEFGVSLTR